MGTRVGRAKELYSFTLSTQTVRVYELDTPVESSLIEASEGLVTGHYVAVSTIALDPKNIELHADYVKAYGLDVTTTAETIVTPVVDELANAGVENLFALIYAGLAFDVIAEGSDTTPETVLGDLGYTIL